MQLRLEGENWNVIFKLPSLKKRAHSKLEVEFILLYTIYVFSEWLVMCELFSFTLRRTCRVFQTGFHEMMQLLQIKLMFLRWPVI